MSLHALLFSGVREMKLAAVLSQGRTRRSRAAQRRALSLRREHTKRSQRVSQPIQNGLMVPWTTCRTMVTSTVPEFLMLNRGTHSAEGAACACDSGRACSRTVVRGQAAPCLDDASLHPTQAAESGLEKRVRLSIRCLSVLWRRECTLQLNEEIKSLQNELLLFCPAALSLSLLELSASRMDFSSDTPLDMLCATLRGTEVDEDLVL